MFFFLLTLEIFCLPGRVSAETVNLIPRLHYIESSLTPGLYTNVNLPLSLFTPYKGGHLPQKQPSSNRMMSLAADFTLEELGPEPTLYVGPLDSPALVYLNGIPISKFGRYGSNYNSTIYYSSSVYLPETLLKEGSNRILIESYLRHEKQVPGGLHIDSFSQVKRDVFLRNLFNVSLIQASIMIALVIALYFLFLAIANKNGSRRNLYFGLFCIAFFLSYTNISLFNDGINEMVIEKISRVGFPLALTFISFFIMEYTKVLNNVRWIKPLILIPAIVMDFITILLPDKQSVAGFFSYVTNLYITPMLLYILAILFYSVFKKKNKDSLVFLLGFILIIITSVMDISALNRVEIPFCWMIPYGYLGLVLAIFATIAIDQSRTTRKAVASEKEALEKNNSLSTLIERVTRASNTLVESGRTLDETSRSVLAEVHESEQENTQIAEKMLEKFSMLEQSIQKIAARMEEEGESIPRAIESQTRVVEETNQTIEEMNRHIEGIASSTANASQSAHELSEMAEKSKESILRSKASIDRIAEHSRFIGDLLANIREIISQTSLLALNASIEATQAGSAGKGFAIVAREIKKLSLESRQNLEDSTVRLRQMGDLIQDSQKLSEEVSNSLLNIINEASDHSGKIHDTLGMVEEQKKESGVIMNGTQSLLKDSLAIRDLTSTQQKENASVQNTLKEVKLLLEEIAASLESQKASAGAIQASIGKMNGILRENRKQIDTLQDAVNGSV